ncbi:MAG: Crp/Fnr family transcriptional regulator [Gammaproteobacteria bacterium]|nr:Crp/Fnr family transcriptional regulator [Gammaproteobacteria bacterium]
MNESLSLFTNIQDEAGKKVLAQAREIRIPAHTTVFRQGESCDNYLLVLDGSIKVFTRSENGREVVLYRVLSGESCTLTTTCLLSQNTYPAEGYTETDIRALVIPIKSFQEGLHRSSDFRQLVFDAYGQRLSEIISLVEEISFGRIDVRLAKALLQHIVGDMTIHITHQSLATELGSVREVISRQLKEFERNQWLELHRGSIEILNSSALEKLAQTTLI